jgi:hypothetical protein
MAKGTRLDHFSTWKKRLGRAFRNHVHGLKRLASALHDSRMI